jgi:hypothetical protein
MGEERPAGMDVRGGARYLEAGAGAERQMNKARSGLSAAHVAPHGPTTVMDARKRE